MKLLHIGSTSVVDGQSTAVPALTEFLDKARRLPEMTSDWKYHRGYMHAQGSGQIERAVYWVGNQLSIVDPTIDMQIPGGAQSLVKGLIHYFRARKSGTLKSAYNAVANTFDDSKAHDFLVSRGSAGWEAEQYRDLTWFRLALYEQEAPVIKHRALWTMFDPDPARDHRFYADIAYRLVIFAGKGQPQMRPPTWVNGSPGAPSLACGSALNERWFKVGLYVPDKVAVPWMAFDAKAHYMRITGRVPGFEDTYWHLSGWERAKEGAKAVGDALGTVAKKAAPALLRMAAGAETGVHGSGLKTGSPVGVRSRWEEKRLMDGGAGDSTVGMGSYARAMWHGETRDFNRKSIVPPGYCFVKFNGSLDVAVVLA